MHGFRVHKRNGGEGNPDNQGPERSEQKNGRGTTSTAQAVNPADDLAIKLRQPKPRTPLKERLIKWGPWLFFGLTLLQIKGEVHKLATILDGGETPIMVQVGPEGKPILAKRSLEGALNPVNVEAFLSECTPLLYRADSKLPKEIGGGADSGVALTDRILIPTPIYLARSCIAPTYADGFMLSRAEGIPKDWQRGASQTLAGLKVGEAKPSKRGSAFRDVTLVGMLVTDNPDGSPRSAQQWARTITVASVTAPRYVLKPNAIEEKYNYFLRRRLQIVSIADAQDVLP
jgi:hypothetical protein